VAGIRCFDFFQIEKQVATKHHLKITVPPEKMQVLERQILNPTSVW